MGWGLKTPVSVCDSTRDNTGLKGGALTAAGLGLLLVFCWPGQISQANYTSVAAVQNEAISLAEQSNHDAGILLADAENNTRPVIRDMGTGSQLISLERRNPPKSRLAEKPVQMASIDLNLPRLEAPEIGVKPKLRQPVVPEARPALPKAQPRLQKKLFGTVELRFDDERKIKAWSSVYYKFLDDTQILKTCLNNAANCTDPFMAEWASQLQSLRNLSTFDKIAAVNSMANRRSYADDLRNYGKSDYWAGPREFLARGGDCEDYALLKFASLLALGVDKKDMRLVVGRLADGTPHAFLAANVGQNEYILDNRQSSVYLTQNRKDYVPKYSMNLSYRWSHVVPQATTT